MNTMNKEKWIGVAAGVVVAAILLFGGSILRFFSGGQIASDNNQMQMNNEQGAPQAGTERELVPGLKATDVTIGTGDEARAGDLVTVHYTGTLENGQKFDSSLDRGQPFQFKLGAGQVIAGWDQGFAGMKVGGKRRLVIAPELGYGAQGAGGVIPPNATLVFDVELLQVAR
jgi:FKBP-type peptidyl-prolyl cis-trans isomerase